MPATGPTPGASLRAWLTAFPLVLVLLPVAVAAIAVTIAVSRSQQAEASRELVQSARSLALAVNADLVGTVRRLELLAQSERLAADDFAGFTRESRAALSRSPDWQNIAVTSASGPQPVNLASDAPDTPVATPQPHQLAAIDRRAPVVSDLFKPRTGTGPAVSVSVPVLREDGRVYSLSARLAFASLDQLAVSQQVRTEGVAAVLDSTLRIVARSRDADRFRGELATEDLRAAIGSAREGNARLTTKDGDSVLAAWAPVGETGWRVAIGVPAAVYEEPLRRSIFWMLLVVAAAGLASLAAGWRMSRSIDSSVRGAAAQANALARGERALAVRGRYRELNELGRALEEAGERLDVAQQDRAAIAGERARLLEAERAAREAAEAANRGKDEFLAMLGHEMRNPLGAMMNAITILSRSGIDPAFAKQALDILRRQGSHLSRIVDDLLDVGRVLAGKIRVVRAPLDLAELVRRATDTLRDSGRLGEHRVTTDIASVWVDGDATRLDQVVTNLLGNAVRYTPSGGDLHIVVRPDGEDGVIEIRDSGAGIAPELLPRIFDLFVQGEQSRARDVGGLGIGLTLARRLVELHDGTITAASAGPGQGATFTVRLPAVAPVAAAATARGPERTVASRRVLVVEDNDDLRETVRAHLVFKGHAVSVARDGRSGIESAVATSPEVAIIDVGLPDMSGLEVALALRERLGARVRLIAVTGYALPDVADAAERAGFDACLFKPVDLASLALHVESEDVARA